MENNKRNPKDFTANCCHIVMPADANHFVNLSGGQLMHWIDICGAMAAMRYSGQNVVTACIDNVSFDKPIKVGQIAKLEAIVTWHGRSSMEVKVDVGIRNYHTDEIVATNSAHLVFVAVDENLKPAPVPEMLISENKADFGAGAERQAQRKLNRKS